MIIADYQLPIADLEQRDQPNDTLQIGNRQLPIGNT